MELGILEEVKEHTDWVNSDVIVEKDSGNHHSPNHTIKRKLRICLDPRDLNEVLERKPCHTCSMDEITGKLQGMTVFTIVDFKKDYWMVVLHPDSRKLTCMVLPFGRFQWTRLPMDTVVAQTFSNPSWIPSLLAWKVSQELLMTWYLQAEMKWNMIEISSIHGKVYEQQPDS